MIPLSFRLPLRVTLPLPGKKEAMLLLFLLLASFPMGSSLALVVYLTSALAICFLFRIPYPDLRNFLISMGLAIVASLVNVVFGKMNLVLVAVYGCYLTIMVSAGIVIYREIGSMNAQEISRLVALILIGDLLINLPAVVLQLAAYGPGDMIQGFSGMGAGATLSQNRTNSIRAGFLIILCLANLRSRHAILVRISLIFNAMVLLLATSMTGIFSAILAACAFFFLRMSFLRFLPFAIFAAGISVSADNINRVVFKTGSVFKFIETLNTRWVPKLEIYSHYFGDMIFNNPQLLWVGEGIGNFANRFSILANFRNLSHFPFKEQVSAVLYSADASEHLIGRYNLENGVLGDSIISVPWSGVLAFLTEWGILGLALLFFAGQPWLSRIWRSRKTSSYALLLLLFLALNLMFDCYLDYPEVVFPFIIIIACLSHTDATRPPVSCIPSPSINSKPE